jgi:hypothetical protein
MSKNSNPKPTAANTIRCDGAIVMWSLSEFSYLQLIHDGLQGLGYDKKYLPNPRTFGACLKDALHDVCGSSTTLIRPLKTDDGTEGFVVVEEQRYNDRNYYNTGLTAKVTQETPPRILLSPFDDKAQKITDGFNKQLGLIRPAQITSCLTAIVGSLGGTPLRPNGCVYWLPQYSLEAWLSVKDVIESAAHVGKNGVYIVRHELDHDAIQCVQDAIVTEIEGAVKRIGKEIMEDELGERALENRRAEAMQLREKIGQFESILSIGLGQLHKAVDNTEVAIAQATLLASTSKQVA